MLTGSAKYPRRSASIFERYAPEAPKVGVSTVRRCIWATTGISVVTSSAALALMLLDLHHWWKLNSPPPARYYETFVVFHRLRGSPLKRRPAIHNMKSTALICALDLTCQRLCCVASLDVTTFPLLPPSPPRMVWPVPNPSMAPEMLLVAFEIAPS